MQEESRVSSGRMVKAQEGLRAIRSEVWRRQAQAVSFREAQASSPAQEGRDSGADAGRPRSTQAGVGRSHRKESASRRNVAERRNNMQASRDSHARIRKQVQGQ
jgi:hypothetical protein